MYIYYNILHVVFIDTYSILMQEYQITRDLLRAGTTWLIAKTMTMARGTVIMIKESL